MNKPKRYLVTSALPYANGPLHLGHLAGAYLPADLYVRYKRLKGEDVAYICGSDEHGAAITIKAIKEGTTPQAIIDKFHNVNKATFQRLGITFDKYHRTSADIHHQTSQDFFRKLYANGEFTKETNEQYYDEEANQFLADRYIKGTCPKCENPDAYGDQCEKCGSTLSPTELINPSSTISGTKPVLKSTSHWFLSLDKHTEWLQDWIEKGTYDGVVLHDPKEWKKHVLGQCKSWLGDLKPRAMTRDLDWGVDVPQEIEGAEGKKLYVWLDAPIGYISATKEWAQEVGKNWEDYWKDEDTKLVHFIGKDNIVFHCIIFPAILKAHGDFILPDNVPANQFMNLEGKKLSTSRGWAVWADDYLEDFKDTPFHVDVLRYYMVKNMPEQKDSDFTWKGFQDSCNKDLVGSLSGFIHRTITLINKYYDGVVPTFDNSAASLEALPEDLKLVFDQLQAETIKVEEFVENYEFREALKAFLDIASNGNDLLSSTEPWKVKDEKQKGNILHICVLRCLLLESLSRIFFVQLPADLYKLLNRKVLGLSQHLFEYFLTSDKFAELISALEGHTVEKQRHLFARVDDEMIQAQVDKLEASTQALNTGIDYPEVKDTCTFDDFMKVDLRVGTIVSSEKMKKAKKLLVLKVDLGFEERTVVSGIAEHFSPEEVIGQQVVLVANLAPRKLRGVESEGMILMAENEKGELEFVSPAKASTNGFGVS